MGRCEINYNLVFFDVRDPRITEAYVFVETNGDCPPVFSGWHHRSFPSTVTTSEILANIQKSVEWPSEAPPFRMNP